MRRISCLLSWFHAICCLVKRTKEKSSVISPFLLQSLLLRSKPFFLLLLHNTGKRCFFHYYLNHKARNASTARRLQSSFIATPLHGSKQQSYVTCNCWSFHWRRSIASCLSRRADCCLLLSSRSAAARPFAHDFDSEASPTGSQQVKKLETRPEKGPRGLQRLAPLQTSWMASSL